MRWTATCALALLLAGLAGCADEAPGLGEEAAADDGAAPVEPHLIEWHGHIVHSRLDFLAHTKDPETVLFPLQQAGFLVEVHDVPEAIEVMVSWNGDAGFRLHPHYKAEDDPGLGGDTLYYGYLSDMFDQSPGCIRVPAEDMAAGVWPMMIHPRDGTMGVDYTITVGIVGAEGHVMDERHGHRSDGEAPVVDHGVEPCELLVEA